MCLQCCLEDAEGIIVVQTRLFRDSLRHRLCFYTGQNFPNAEFGKAKGVAHAVGPSSIIPNQSRMVAIQERDCSPQLGGPVLVASRVINLTTAAIGCNANWVPETLLMVGHGAPSWAIAWQLRLCSGRFEAAVRHGCLQAAISHSLPKTWVCCVFWGQGLDILGGSCIELRVQPPLDGASCMLPESCIRGVRSPSGRFTKACS